MRLVFLTQYYPPEIGAPQTRLAALTRALVQRGWHVEVVTAMPHHLMGRILHGYRGRIYSCEKLDGATVHRTWVYAASGTGVRRMLNYLSFAFSCLLGLLRVRRPDAIFVESPPLFLAVPGWLAAKRYRCKLIFNVADLWPDAIRELGVLRSGPLLGVAERLEAWTYRRATVVNAVTSGIERSLRERKGVPVTKLRFLPNGVDTERLAPCERSVALAQRLQLDDRPLFVYAGTHGIAQGLHTLVDAAALAPYVTVLCIGGGTTKAALMAYARARNVENVRFLDPVPLDEIPEYFSLAVASVVLLVRSELHRDARPSKLFASFACGVPVIYGGEGEGADIVEHAGAGLVVPPEDPAALAMAMATLAADPVQRTRMANNARTLAVERFAWSGIVDRWVASL